MRKKPLQFWPSCKLIKQTFGCFQAFIYLHSISTSITNIANNTQEQRQQQQRNNKNEKEVDPLSRNRRGLKSSFETFLERKDRLYYQNEHEERQKNYYAHKKNNNYYYL